MSDIFLLKATVIARQGFIASLTVVVHLAKFFKELALTHVVLYEFCLQVRPRRD